MKRKGEGTLPKNAGTDQKKQKTKKSSGKGSKYWDGLDGWKPVDVGDDFLLGAEEGGFAGLEVLEDASIIDPSMLSGGKQEGELGEFEAEVGHVGGPKAQEHAGGEREKEAPEALHARIAALEAELKGGKKQLQLLQQQQQQRGDGQGPQPLSKRAAHKLELQKKWQTRKEAKQKAKQKRREAEQQQRQGGNKGRQAAGGQGVAEEGPKAEGMKAKKSKKQRGVQVAEEQGEKGEVDLSAWRAFALHPLLEQALGQMKFSTPTAIQAAVLPAATHDRADIIGAAQTGSGKTLAFGLPIMQHLLQEREVAEATGEPVPYEGKLRALVLTPTRELALQVCSHLTVLGIASQIRVAAIVGGLALVKQERLLRAHPSVVVATPGRLWDLMREGHGHLADLSGLCCLVLDEADRMMQQGHFQELHSILELVPRPGGGSARETTFDPDFHETLRHAEAKEQQQLLRRSQNKGGKRVDDESHSGGSGSESEGQEGEHEGDDEGNTGEEGLSSQEGSEEESEEDWKSCKNPEGSVPGGSERGTDEEEMGTGGGSDGDVQGGSESFDGEDFHSLSEGEDDDDGHQGEGNAASDDDEEEEDGMELKMGGEDGGEGSGEEEQRKASSKQAGPGGAGAAQDTQQANRAASKGKVPKGNGVQTFVFSATLTLPSSLRKRLRRGGGGAMGGVGFEKLMDKIPFRGTPKVIDLTAVGDGSEKKLKVASGVQEARIECLEKERDALLYYLLARHPGRTLVFVNAVSALRRLAALLKLLGLPSHSLHAQQQQRQRLKALDRFRSADNAVLVATDVAARGLDIKDVRCVVHYQLPASADTYIHRSGRTARAGAEGLSVALVVPNEAPRWIALNRAMGREDNKQQPPLFPVDLTLMPQVRARLFLAERVDKAERVERKASAEHAWTSRTAELVGINVSDDEQPATKKPRTADRQEKRKKVKGQGGAQDEDPLAIAQARKLARERVAVAGLKAELGQLLSLPLAPRMSKSFFTGGAVGGVNAAMHRVGPHATGNNLPSNKSNQGAGSGASAGADGGASKKSSTQEAGVKGHGAQHLDNQEDAAQSTGTKGVDEQGSQGAHGRQRGRGESLTGGSDGSEPVQGIAEAVAYAARLQQGKDAVKAAQEAKRNAKVAKAAARAASSRAAGDGVIGSSASSGAAASAALSSEKLEAIVLPAIVGGGLLKGAKQLRQQQQQQVSKPAQEGLERSKQQKLHRKQLQKQLQQQRRLNVASKAAKRVGALPVRSGSMGKKAGRKKGVVVVPPAMGRDTQGPDALEALRRRVAILGGK